MKKVLSLVLVLALLLCQASFVFADTDYMLADANHYTGHSDGCGDFDFDIYMDYTWFIKGDNTVYYNEIGKFCTVMAAAAYNDGASSTAEGNIPGYGTAFMDAVGLSDTLKIDVDHNDGTANTDIHDTANMLLGHVSEKYKGTNYEIIFVSVRGTHTDDDMINDLDFGADSDRYTQLSGSNHPDWVNHKNHKGFDVSATRCINVINQYVNQYVDKNAQKIIVFTGHSKGATVANLIAARFEKEEAYKDYKTFAYCIAPCNNTEASQDVIDSYRTIFNINNADDLITIMPFKEWDYKRYGRTLIVTPADNADLYLQITGNAYERNSLTRDGVLFAEITNSRSGFYEIDYSENSHTDMGDGAKILMDGNYNNVKNKLQSYGLMEYVDLQYKQVSTFGITKIYSLDLYCSPVFLLQLFVKIKDELAEEDYVDLMALQMLLPQKYYTYLMQVAPEIATIGLAHCAPSIYVCSCASQFTTPLGESVSFTAEQFIDPNADTGSIFGEGSTTALIIMAGLVVATGVAIATGKKKKKA